MSKMADFEGLYLFCLLCRILKELRNLCFFFNSLYNGMIFIKFKNIFFSALEGNKIHVF
jgi:hypothetical protein